MSGQRYSLQCSASAIQFMYNSFFQFFFNPMSCEPVHFVHVFALIPPRPLSSMQLINCTASKPGIGADDDDDEVMLNVLRCRLTYQGQAVTNAEAWFNKSLRPRKPEGSLGRTAQDGHLDSHTQLLNYECIGADDAAFLSKCSAQRDVTRLITRCAHPLLYVHIIWHPRMCTCCLFRRRIELNQQPMRRFLTMTRFIFVTVVCTMARLSL